MLAECLLPQSHSESAAVKVSVALVSQVAVFSALLYYFGWSRTEALLNYYGLDSTVVGLSTTDYVLRGVHPISPIVVGAAFVVLVAVSVHRNVVTPSLLGRRRGHDVVLLVCGRVHVLCWIALAVAAGGELFARGGGGLLGVLQPILLAGASLTLLYIDQIRARVDRGAHAHRRSGLRRYTLIGLSVIGVTWSLAVYAAIDGQAFAADTVLRESPDVVVRSTEQLMPGRPGVDETPVTTPGSKFRYSYRNVKILLKAGGKYYLVPADWRPGVGSVAIVADNDTVQINVLH